MYTRYSKRMLISWRRNSIPKDLQRSLPTGSSTMLIFTPEVSIRNLTAGDRDVRRPWRDLDTCFSGTAEEDSEISQKRPRRRRWRLTSAISSVNRPFFGYAFSPRLRYQDSGWQPARLSLILFYQLVI